MAGEDLKLIDLELAQLTPPQHMWRWVGPPDDFWTQGALLHEYLVDRSGITPSSSILDIGCGIGKHAVHFAKFLLPPGEYEGFDVEPQGIEWCNNAITPKYPHVNFRCVDVQSSMYSPESKGLASKFTFPYDSERFDLVYLGSVFSHMFYADIENYVSEIRRVLKPGGLVIATGYLLDHSKRAGINAGTSAFTFAVLHEDSWVEHMDPPEGAVAHDKARIKDLLEEKGLVAEEFRLGSWHSSGAQDQDFIIARRPFT